MNRRAILKGALGGVLGLTLPPFARSAFTHAVLAQLRGLPGAGRVTTVFNTHWHREQVSGNLAFGRSGAKIIAHEKTRAHLATDYYLQDEDRYEKALPAEARPTVTFFAGDQTPDGDIYVFFRDANVLAAGDAISPLKDPALDWFGGGWLGGRVDAQEKLLKLSNAETRIVPSYGPVVGRAELQAEFDMTRALFDRMLDLVRKGMSAQDMLDAGLMKDLNRTFHDPYRFTYDAHKGFWAHHNSLAPDVL